MSIGFKPFAQCRIRCAPMSEIGQGKLHGEKAKRAERRRRDDEDEYTGPGERPKPPDLEGRIERYSKQWEECGEIIYEDWQAAGEDQTALEEAMERAA